MIFEFQPPWEDCWDELHGCYITERTESVGGVEDAEMANPEM